MAQPKEWPEVRAAVEELRNQDVPLQEVLEEADISGTAWHKWVAGENNPTEESLQKVVGAVERIVARIHNRRSPTLERLAIASWLRFLADQLAAGAKVWELTPTVDASEQGVSPSDLERMLRLLEEPGPENGPNGDGK